jgi:hypothetical protein
MPVAKDARDQLIEWLQKQNTHLEATNLQLLAMVERLANPVHIIQALNPPPQPAPAPPGSPYDQDVAPQLPDDPWSNPDIPTSALVGRGWGIPPDIPDVGSPMKNDLPDG